MINKQIKLLIFLLITPAFSAIAETAETTGTVYPLVTYKCDTEADVITLTNSLLKNQEGAAYNYSDEDGTYSPWNLIEVEQKANSTRVIRTKKITKVCKLSSGEYTVIIEPQVFSKTMSGTCGASISSAFTIIFDDFELRERTPFEDFCVGNSPIITRVSVFGKTSEVKIKRLPRYKFY